MPGARTLTTKIISALESVKNTSEINDVLGDITQNVGMAGYTYWAVNVPGRAVRDPFIITSLSDEWGIEYATKGYVHVDPVVVSSPKHITPYYWGTKDYLKTITKKEQLVFSDAQKHGIKFGILVPVHAPGNEFSAISMVADSNETEKEFINKFTKRSLALGSVAPHIHATVRRLLNVVESEEIARLLSAREVECLSWVAQGKSLADIAEILTISRTTVITHVNRAKAKMGVSTSQQAVLLLTASGLVQHEKYGTNI